MSLKRERRPIAGAGAEKSTWVGAHSQYTAWRRWAHKADDRYLTERQAHAAALVQAGRCPTPEAALRLLDAGEGAA